MKGILLLAMAMVGVTSAIRGEPGRANLDICYGCLECKAHRMEMMKMPCCREVRDIWKRIWKSGNEEPYPDCSPDGNFKVFLTPASASALTNMDKRSLLRTSRLMKIVLKGLY